MKKKKIIKKSKSLITPLFVCIGFLGSLLLFFGFNSDGTLSDEMQSAGMFGIGIFTIWGITRIVNSYMEQRELEDLK